MNYQARVFNMLGLKANQPFELTYVSQNKRQKISGVYRIKAVDLTLQECVGKKWEDCTLYNISHILSGKLSVHKIQEVITMSLTEKATLTFLKSQGYNFVVITRSGECVAFEKKPVRFNDSWVNDEIYAGSNFITLTTPLTFLSWEDDEPFYIDERVLNEEFFKVALDK